MLHVYFAVEKLAPVQAATKIDKVEKYVITREGRNDTDLFRIVYGNSKCPVNACEYSTAHMIDATQCICSCTPGYPTFLPALGMCGDTKTVKDTLFDSKYTCTYISEDLAFVKKNVKKAIRVHVPFTAQNLVISSCYAEDRNVQRIMTPMQGQCTAH